MRTVLFYMIWFGFAAAFAQPDFKFEHIGTAEGLSHNTVTAILQDQRGFMWFSTVDGLNRYDGFRCKVFAHDPADSTTLSSNFIQTIYEDRAGVLWVGTRDGGLNRLNRKTGRFRRFRHSPDDPGSLSHNQVNAILEDRDGRFWISTTGGGLNLMDRERGTFIHFRHDPQQPFSLPDDEVYPVFEDAAGRLVIGTAKGVAVLERSEIEGITRENAADIRFQPFFGDATPRPSFVQSIFSDADGDLWFGTRNEGIFRCILENGRVKRVIRYLNDPDNPNSIGHNIADALFQDDNGLIWIASENAGLDLFDKRKNRFRHIRHKPMNSSSLSHNNISAFFRDRRGNLWLGTWGNGVNKLVWEKDKFVHIQHDPDHPNSLSNNFVFAICADRRGDVWIGSLGGGLSRWCRDTGKWRQFTANSAQPNHLSDDNVWAITEDRRGDLWIGTERGGLNRLRLKGRNGATFSHFRLNPKKPQGMLEDNIRVIYEDPSPDAHWLWIGTEKSGFSRFDAQTGKWRHFQQNPQDPHSLSSNRVRAFWKDRSGTLWIGTTDGGLNRMIDANGTARFDHFRHDPQNPHSLTNDDVRCIIEDRAGRFWIGTYGGGLNLLNRETGEFTRFAKKEGLPNNFIYGILEDGDGDLWISTNRGVACFDPAARSFKNYSVLDGLQADEFNSGAYFRDKTGEMFFGGVNGVNLFDPQKLKSPSAATPPPVVFTELRIMGKPASLDSAISEIRQLRLSWQDKSFSLGFAALDFTAPARNQYAYKLEGFDDDWIFSGVRRYVSYTNLDPGRYLLHVKAANSDGVWNEQGQSLRIIIPPPFWQTGWFILLAAAGLVALIGAGYRVREHYRVYRQEKYVGHFKIRRKLGEGGMGVVFLAFDKLNKREVALKLLNQRLEDTRDGVKRFLQEAEIGKQLVHPNIVKIYEAGSNEKVRFISMEYLNGVTLKKRLSEETALPAAKILHISRQVLSGLGAIHQKGFVHRDLKSDNIMLLPGSRVKIMDFGLARASTLTTIADRQQLLGTLGYMSPEQTLGKNVDQRSDIYAFGVMLYEMVFREMPFVAQNEMELIFAIHNDPPPRLQAKTGAPFAKIIAKCLEKDPAMRYDSVAQLHLNLDKHAGRDHAQRFQNVAYEA